MKTALIIMVLTPQLLLAQINHMKGFEEILSWDEITYYHPKGLLPSIDLDGSYTEGYQYIYKHWEFSEEHYLEILKECETFLEHQNESIFSPHYCKASAQCLPLEG